MDFKYSLVTFFFFQLNAGDTRGAYNKFPDIFRMGTFIDSTHMKL